MIADGNAVHAGEPCYLRSSSETWIVSKRKCREIGESPSMMWKRSIVQGCEARRRGGGAAAAALALALVLAVSSSTGHHSRLYVTSLFMFTSKFTQGWQRSQICPPD